MKPAIFLDRDGTLNEEMGYINHPDRFRLFPFVFEAVKIFNHMDFKVIVVTNQAGVARGYFDESLLRLIHEKMLNDFNERDCRIDGLYYCPHHPRGIVKAYRKNCNCRKPKPGMIIQAQKDHDIDLRKSFMIGDRYKDIVFGKLLELKTGFVLTGYGKGEYVYQSQQWSVKPDLIADNLLTIAQNILSLEGKGAIQSQTEEKKLR